MEVNNLIDDSQQGFRNKHSYQTRLLDILAHVIDLHMTRTTIKLLILIVYLDLKKAFDKVPDERLMAKVNAHGIQCDGSRWIRNSFAGRRQRVSIKPIAIEHQSHLVHHKVVY